MGKLIDFKNREFRLSVIVSSLILAAYFTLEALKIITHNCPFSYLNPWQYFFQCTGFDILIGLAISIACFIVIFLIVKKFKEIKQNTNV